ncbi:MAG: anti-sigma factor antagonist [Candidatus Cloacimonadota bacterium]|jgi:anti-sigma B factor antagonist|nr:anti-sigma factor antagonist [Candidatus Cloacimonadota bacterium]
MKLELKQKGNYAILKIIGGLDAAHTKEFKQQFQTYAEENINFIFDLSQMDFMDSTGFGAIVSVYKLIKEVGGVILIANLQSKPKMLFKITRADKIFKVFDNLQAAEDYLK